MDETPSLRPLLRVAAALVLCGLAVSAFALGGAASALLTPLPTAWMAPTMALAIGLGIALSWVLAEGLPWRLARRLTVVGVLAATLYFSGQTMRGLYVVLTFSGDVQADEVSLLVTGFGNGHLQAVHRSLAGPVRRIPIRADADVGEPRGMCVTVGIERTAGGAERLAGEEVGEEDVGPCE